MSVEPAYRGGAGEPLVLIHGFTDTWRTWTRLLPLLEPHHELFAPTLPGHHGGAALEAGITPARGVIADALERQLDAAGIETAHMVGSSLGGWIALELAARGRARAVVGVCPAGFVERGSRAERATFAYFTRTGISFKFATPRLLETVARRPRLRALALRDVVAYPQRINATEAMALITGAAGCTVAGDWLAAARKQDMYGELERIDCPIRILYGIRDRLLRWPSSYTRLQQKLPGVEVIALDGLGHLPMWDDPELVARRILEVTAGASVEPAESGELTGAGAS